MTRQELRDRIHAAIEEYVSSPEAYEDPQLVIDRNTGSVELRELEETDSDTPDLDVYDVMDFVEMTPEGEWRVSDDAVDTAASDEYDDLPKV